MAVDMMAEVGTRIDHYTELLEQWKDGKKVLAEKRFKVTDDIAKLHYLECSIYMLEKHMTYISSDYKTAYYYKNAITTKGLKTDEVKDKPSV